MSKDIWGNTGLHYLAKKKQWKAIDLIFSTLMELNESISLLTLVERVDVNVTNHCDESLIEILFNANVGKNFIEFVATYMEKYNIDLSELGSIISHEKDNKESPILKLMNDIFNKQIKTNNVTTVYGPKVCLKKSKQILSMVLNPNYSTVCGPNV